MSATHQAYPHARTTLSLWAVPAPIEPPSASVVAAVVVFGDIHETWDDGETVIRFSRARLEREDMRLLLREDLARAGGVRVIWDEREEQIVRVLDSGPLTMTPQLQSVGNRYAEARMRGAPRYRVAPPAQDAVAA